MSVIPLNPVGTQSASSDHALNEIIELLLQNQVTEASVTARQTAFLDEKRNASQQITSVVQQAISLLNSDGDELRQD